MKLSFTWRQGGVALIALWCALSPLPANSADPDGRFAVEGIGIQTCEQFVGGRLLNSEDYVRSQGWLEGYFTAVNRFAPKTYDAAPWETTDVLALIVDAHCRETPSAYFFEIVQGLVAILRIDRLEKVSPTLTLTADDQIILIYEEVLRRAQIALADRGLYDDAADGTFGPKTQSAIEKFQQSASLEVTGMPDPLTLWVLLKP